LIGILIPDIANYFFADVIKGIQSVTDDRQYDLVLCTTDGDYQKEIEVLRRLQLRKVDGIITAAMALSTRKSGCDFIKDLAQKGQHIVSISPVWEDFPGDFVEVNNTRGAAMATNHLIDLGHQKIAYIGGSLESISAQQRLAGYQEAMKSANIPVTDNLIVNGDFSFGGGYNAARKMLSLESSPTAIFAANDVMALGAIQAIKESGKSIPEELAVVGFDDIPISNMAQPALTTIRQPRNEIGRKSAEILLDRINDKLTDEKIGIVIQPKLIVRSSSVVAGGK
ncbi:MAG: substrate-binding domain-containing protein, partial [Victivallaceae bacterium]|nr:substrate-binding domain-containing protein [Victivallaceae bacterium]